MYCPTILLIDLLIDLVAPITEIAPLVSNSNASDIESTLSYRPK